jgi:DegV family protein with EDD domain
MSVKVITDSTSYIPADLLQELDITVVPLSVNFPDESFLETEVDYAYFYQKIETGGVIPTSSQPSTGDIYERFHRILEEGHDILAIFLSSLMSGTFQSALSIRERLLKEFPKALISVLDSRTNCMSLGYPVLAAARAAAQGDPRGQISAMASDLIQRMHF